MVAESPDIMFDFIMCPESIHKTRFFLESRKHDGLKYKSIPADRGSSDPVVCPLRTAHEDTK